MATKLSVRDQVQASYNKNRRRVNDTRDISPDYGHVDYDGPLSMREPDSGKKAKTRHFKKGGMVKGRDYAK